MGPRNISTILLRDLETDDAGLNLDRVAPFPSGDRCSPGKTEITILEISKELDRGQDDASGDPDKLSVRDGLLNTLVGVFKGVCGGRDFFGGGGSSLPLDDFLFCCQIMHLLEVALTRIRLTLRR